MFKTVKLVKFCKEKILLNITITVVITSFFVSPNLVLSGAKQGMSFCTKTLVPSLFPFMVLSTLIVNLNFCHKLGRLLNPVTHYLFKLPGVVAPTIFLGLIGGYPTGAGGTAALLKKGLIDKQQAEKLAYFVVGSGPAFVVTVVGSRLLQNETLGLILFLSQILASLLVGLVCSFLFKNKTATQQNNQEKPNNGTFSEALIESVSVSSNNIINMCAFVVLFSSFLQIIKNGRAILLTTDLLQAMGLNKNMVNVLITFIFEVTNGCFDAVKYHLPIPIISFGIAWAGLCVHLQIFYCLRFIKLSKLKFIAFRLLHGVLAGVISYIILTFLPTSMDVSCVKIYTFKESSFCFAPSSFALLFLCLFFLSTLTSKNVAFSNVNNPSKIYSKKGCKNNGKSHKTQNK